MECSNCNYKIQLDNKFCGNCGTQIKNSLDIEQSSENINIPNSDNVPFSFKKLLLIILSIIIYIVVSWILLGLFVGINYAVYGKGIGLFSALGIASFWLSYKFVKWLWKKYFNTHKP